MKAVVFGYGEMGCTGLEAVLASGYFWWKGRAEEQSGSLLGVAMTVYQAPIVPPSSVPGATQAAGSYPTEKARAEAGEKIYLDSNLGAGGRGACCVAGLRSGGGVGGGEGEGAFVDEGVSEVASEVFCGWRGDGDASVCGGDIRGDEGTIWFEAGEWGASDAGSGGGVVHGEGSAGEAV